MGDSINRKKVAGSFLWKFIERVLSQGVSLVIQIILARILLPETFGSLAIIVAITTFAGIFSQSGFSTFIVQKKDLTKDDVSNTYFVSLVISIVLYFIVFLFSETIASFYGDDDLVWPLRIMGLTIVLNSIYSIQTAILSRNFKFKQILLRSIITIPVSGIISIFMAYNGFGIWSLVAQQIVNLGLTVILLECSLKEHYFPKFNYKNTKTIFSFGGKILIGSLIAELHDSLRSLLIGKYYSKNDLAFYDKGYTYASYFSEIAKSTLTGVLLPTFSRFQTEQDKIKSISRIMVSITGFVMFPSLIGVAIISKELVLILLTEKWLVASTFLAVFCILRIPYIIKSIEIQAFYALGRTDITLVYGIISCLVNIVVLFFTVRLGTIYVAIGGLVVEVMCLFSIWIISEKLYKYTFSEHLADIWKSLFASILMCTVFVLDLFNLGMLFTALLKVLLAILIYFAVGAIMGNKSMQYCFNVIKNTKLQRSKQ